MNSALYDAIRTRRVTRAMSDEPVDHDQLELVVRAARYAPSGGNRRLQPVVPVDDETTLRLHRMVSPGMLPRPRAAAVVCVDERRARSYGFEPNSPALALDVGTTAATLLLAAHAVGLASCPVTSFSRAAAARIMKLEPEVSPRLIVCLGHASAHQPPAMGAWASRPTRP